jgi:hypothetical protein
LPPSPTLGGLLAFVVVLGGTVAFVRRRTAGVQKYRPVMNMHDSDEKSIEMEGTFVGSLPNRASHSDGSLQGTPLPTSCFGWGLSLSSQLFSFHEKNEGGQGLGLL